MEEGKKRGGSKGCPFGLPISLGCKNIGQQIKNMTPILTEKGLDYSNVENNFKKLYYCLTGPDKNKRRCPYAKDIDGVNGFVMCTFGCKEDANEDNNSEQISKTQFPVEGSPSQINVFDTNPTNNGLPLYGDSSFNDDNIREIPIGLANVGRDNPKLT